MTEKRQNEMCCEVLGWARATVIDGVSGGEPCIFHDSQNVVTVYQWFTRDDNMARLLRAEVIKRNLSVEFISELIAATHPDPDATLSGWMNPQTRRQVGALSYLDAAALMQSSAQEIVEAALRALGKWQEEAG